MDAGEFNAGGNPAMRGGGGGGGSRSTPSRRFGKADFRKDLCFRDLGGGGVFFLRGRQGLFSGGVFGILPVRTSSL